MRNLIPIMIAAVLTGPAPLAFAQSSGDDPLEAMAVKFLEGYEVQNSQQVLQQIEAQLDPADAHQSVFLPTADISPMAMAILALEAVEGTRDRVRYRVTYGIEQIPNPPKYSPLPLSFIQIDRFSLGSAIRQDAITSYGAENVAPPEAFDVGPHVSWRLITGPVMGNRAVVHAIGRIALSDAQVQDMTCLKVLCLSSNMNIESAAPWGEMKETSLNLEVAYPVARAGLLTPAAALEQLTNGDDFAKAGRPRDVPGLPDPLLEAVIEINLAQGSVLDAGMRRGELMDDSVTALWKRITVLPTGEDAATPTTYVASAYECGRGPQFPPNGGLCP
jgi:Ca-activated chloride channel family protein